jgi:type VI secretion system protein ImpH
VAGEDRTAIHALELERELRQEPYRFGFFYALRQLECTYSDRPRFGQATSPGEIPIRLGQEPSMLFAPSTLASFEPWGEDLPSTLHVFFLGLFGPNGPLPLHLTDFVRDRWRNHNDTTFIGFADVFHHRILSLFYRAWANAQPTVSFDRPDGHRYGVYVGSPFGIGMPSFRDRDAMPDLAKLHYSARLAAQTKSAEGLVAIIRDFFGVPAEILQFIGEWLRLPYRYRCRLGEGPETGTLGSTVTIGESVYECQHKFRILFGPLGLAAYERMLPGGDSLRRLVAVVRNYIGDELAWEVNLLLRKEEVPKIDLGRYGRLGWTTWLGTRTADRDADDLVLNPWVKAVG